jgi:hypothetical protein
MIDPLLRQQQAKGQHAAAGLEQEEIEDEGDAHGPVWLSCVGEDV